MGRCMSFFYMKKFPYYINFWTTGEKRWGPFVYARNESYSASFGVEYTGSKEDQEHNTFRVTMFWRTFILVLPNILRGVKTTRKAHWGPEQAKKWGEFFTEEHRRRYGFSFHRSDGCLHYSYGIQTNDSRTDKTSVWSIPWLNRRFHRHSLYDLKGKLLIHLTDDGKRTISYDNYEFGRAVEDLQPSRYFKFVDYDGEVIAAKVTIEEREWRHGTGYFKWLSKFVKPTISRYIELKYSAEVGDRKGSWKGGAIGQSFNIDNETLHEEGFRNFCQEKGLTFLEEMVDKDEIAATFQALWGHKELPPAQEAASV